MPARSRCRLARCFQTTKSAMARAVQATAGGRAGQEGRGRPGTGPPRWRPATRSGSPASVRAKARRPTPVARGARGRKAPAPVATPLPPRKPSHTGYMCPSTAAAAARAAQRAPWPLEPLHAERGHGTLGRVEQEGEDPRAPPGAAHHVRGAHVPAPHRAHVAHPEQARHQEAEGNGAEEIGAGEEESRASHRGRSISGRLEFGRPGRPTMKPAYAGSGYRLSGV